VIRFLIPLAFLAEPALSHGGHTGVASEFHLLGHFAGSALLLLAPFACRALRWRHSRRRGNALENDRHFPA
jgi:hypothetical protein